MFENFFPISGIKEPEKIRVLIFSNQLLCHVPLKALLDPLEQRIAQLEQQLKEKKL